MAARRISLGSDAEIASRGFLRQPVETIDARSGANLNVAGSGRRVVSQDEGVGVRYVTHADVVAVSHAVDCENPLYLLV